LTLQGLDILWGHCLLRETDSEIQRGLLASIYLAAVWSLALLSLSLLGQLILPLLFLLPAASPVFSSATGSPVLFGLLSPVPVATALTTLTMALLEYIVIQEEQLHVLYQVEGTVADITALL
jgi:hypothetical protein